jgi:glycosyltransferase involved in cell wall biosynthesis
MQGAQALGNAESCIGCLTAEFVQALVERQSQIVAAVSVDSRLHPPEFLHASLNHIGVTDFDEPLSVLPNERLIFHAFSDAEDLSLERIWPKWAQAPAVGLVLTMSGAPKPTYPDSGRNGPVRNLPDSRFGVVEAADALIVNSHTTANDLTGLLCVDPERLFVASCGVSDRYTPHALGRARALRLLPANLGIEADFLLSIVSVDSHDRLPALIRAYASLPSNLSDQHQLVVTASGADPDQLAALRHEATALGVVGRVIILVDVHDPTMILLCQACHAFVSPSLDDCLGLPVIKAMSCGAASIVSNIEPLCEIVSDPGARFDPTHDAGIAGALRRVLTDEHFVECRRQAGLRDAARYSWDAWEQSVLAAYDYAAQRRP